MEEHDKTDGWSDGWHTRASTGDSFSTLRDSVVGAAKEERECTRKLTVRLALKGSAAFTSALLLGNKETGSKGLLRTLGSSTSAAAVGAAGFLTSMAAQSSTDDHEKRNTSDLGWGDFGDGYGYYGKDGNRFD